MNEEEGAPLILGEVKMVVEKGHGREKKKLVAVKCLRERWEMVVSKVKEEGRVMEE